MNACNHGVAARDLTIRKRMDRNSRALHCYRAFMTKVEWLVIAAIVLILAALIVPAIDRATAEHVSVGSGVVVKKVYTGATHSMGVGFASNGRSSGPVVVSSSTPEEWVVVVRHGSETFSAKVDANTWGEVEDGAEVEVLEIRGTIGTWGKTIKSR
jgi:hypothetical protein